MVLGSPRQSSYQYVASIGCTRSPLVSSVVGGPSSIRCKGSSILRCLEVLSASLYSGEGGSGVFRCRCLWWFQVSSAVRSSGVFVPGVFRCLGFRFFKGWWYCCPQVYRALVSSGVCGSGAFKYLCPWYLPMSMVMMFSIVGCPSVFR